MWTWLSRGDSWVEYADRRRRRRRHFVGATAPPATVGRRAATVGNKYPARRRRLRKTGAD